MENSENCAKIVDKDPTLEASRAPSQSCCYSQRAQSPHIAECLVKEIAKPAKDAVNKVVRSRDLVSYCAEEGV
ncbi:NADP-dependent glyceraldehyde-3-phosphate dehydrogenase [Camellia lanceoleosa]|uniref:NADP-dependent glyceraldehyde-3-phosphate dehydrogenase n=1 Tax=Camellia lanceoleosa TaxID=1840588 RepID=A0ACC0J3Z9_9ERIC|nr:NADP-dependent glyceraldehyde-3-phosphate dehydrogenase [Camellia lanceoleosa]